MAQRWIRRGRDGGEIRSCSCITYGCGIHAQRNALLL